MSTSSELSGTESGAAGADAEVLVFKERLAKIEEELKR
jgi:hypothetical protein